MTKQEVIQLLASEKNERGIANWEKMYEGPMTSFGIGLTQLKKIAKQVGKNHDLALELWDENIYDCRIMATLIDEPKKVSREQVEAQVKDLDFWMMMHSYSSNLMPKVAFVQELFEEWKGDKDDNRRCFAYNLLYQIAKTNKRLDDAFFEPHVAYIKAHLQGEKNFIKDAMNNSLWAIGMRSKNLNNQAIDAARSIGKVEVDYGQNSCEALDIMKHLTSERLQKKLG